MSSSLHVKEMKEMEIAIEPDIGREREFAREMVIGREIEKIKIDKFTIVHIELMYFDQRWAVRK
jgi:hypothetical protein